MSQDYAAIIELPNHKRGDRWPPSPDGTGKITIGPVIIDGTTPSVPLDRVEMRMTNSGRLYVLDSDEGRNPDAPITIVNPATWEVEIGEIEHFLPRAGEWAWDMAFYSGGVGAPLTIYKGVVTATNDI